MAALLAWHRTLGTISVESVSSSRAEMFYWLTITFSQTLGTALGDWVADSSLGYAGSAMLFGTALAVLALLYAFTRANHVALFWAAFILTRPLGATVGDFFDKPVAKGGLDVSRPVASLLLGIAIAVLIAMLPQRASGQLAQSRDL